MSTSVVNFVKDSYQIRVREALHDGRLLHEILDVRRRLIGVGAQPLDGHLDRYLPRRARRARARRATVRRRRRALVLTSRRRGACPSWRRTGKRTDGCCSCGRHCRPGHDGRAGEERAPHLAELAGAEPLLEVETRERDLPAVLRALTQVRHERPRPLARTAQRTAQPVCALCTRNEKRALEKKEGWYNASNRVYNLHYSSAQNNSINKQDTNRITESWQVI